MLIHERMTRNPITIPPSMPVADALQLMRKKSIRRLPIVDPKSGKVVGIVTEKELLYASPSPATSLSIHEINYLLAKLTVDKIMSTDLITVTEDTPIEEAARIMVDHQIGGLLVMRGEELIGIITETDLFKTFIELFGARCEGVRLTIVVPERKGELYEISQAITEIGGNIVTLGTFWGDDPSTRLLTIRVSEVTQEDLVAKMEAIGAEVIDARVCRIS